MRDLKLVIFDFDNTLWDFTTAYTDAMEALVGAVAGTSGIDRTAIIKGFRQVAQDKRTLKGVGHLDHHPDLRALHGDACLKAAYSGAVALYHRLHDERLNLYAGIEDMLAELRGRGLHLACYSETNGECAGKRFAALGLDGHFDALYTPACHFPWSGTFDTQLRMTRHVPLDHPWPKSDSRGVDTILADFGVTPGEAVMVGDSLVRDIAMARAAGLGTIWARYGVLPTSRIILDTTHWTREMEEDHMRAERSGITADAIADSPAELPELLAAPLEMAPAPSQLWNQGAAIGA